MITAAKPRRRMKSELWPVPFPGEKEEPMCRVKVGSELDGAGIVRRFRAGRGAGLPLALLIAIAAGSVGQTVEAPRGGPARVARPLANGQEPRVLQQADFRPESRKRFVVSGPVAWANDAVELGEGAEVAWATSMGPVADLEVSVQPVAEAKAAGAGDGPAETWLTFGVGSNGYAGAALVGNRVDGKDHLTVAILAVNPAEGGEPRVRVVRSATVDAPRAGTWVVRYNYGVVSVEGDGRECLIGDTGLGEFPLTGVRLRQPARSVRLGAFRIAAIAPRAQPAGAEAARKKKLLPEWEKAAAASQAAFQKREWKECLQNLGREQALDEELFGADSLFAVQRAGLRGLVLTQLGELADAEQVYRAAHAACVKIVGERHTESARLERDLGSTLAKRGRPADALALLRPAARRISEILGAGQAESRLAVQMVASALGDAGDWRGAAAVYETLIPTRTPDPAREGLESASLREGYALALEEMSDYRAAGQQNAAVASIYERVKGPSSREALHARLWWARDLEKMGDLARARELFETVRERSAHGPPEAQAEGDDATFELANFHVSIGDPETAVRLLAEAVASTARRSGRDSREYAVALGQQANALAGLARFAEAAETYRHSAAVFRKCGPGSLKELGPSLSQLGVIEAALGQFERAERDTKEGIRLSQDARVDSPMIAQDYIQLGEIQYALKRLDDCERSLKAAADLLEPLGEGSARAKVSCFLAMAHLAEGRQQWARALELEDRVLEICRTSPGLGTDQKVTALFSKSVTCQLQGDWAAAYDLQRRALDVNLDAAAHLIGSLTEAEAVRYSESLQLIRSDRLGLARQVRLLGVEAIRPLLKSWPTPKADDEYRIVWQTKAMATRLLGERHEKGDTDPSTAPQRSALAAVRRELGALYAATAEPPAETIARLTRTKEELERELARRRGRDPEASPLSRAQSVEQLANVLPPDAVLIDFVALDESRFRTPNVVASRVSDRHYSAYVLRVAGSPRRISIDWVDLGDAGPIDESAEAWTRQNGARGLEPIESGPPLNDEAGKRLARDVWSRLDGLVRDARMVFVVPDGPLHLVPWAALPDPRDGRRVLAERLSFVTLAYGQQLLQPSLSPRAPDDRCLLVGNVAFGRPAPDRPAWRPLPGTKAEVEKVAAILQGRLSVRLVEDARASKDAVAAELAGCRWIHLATHGFFKRLPEVPAGASNRWELLRLAGDPAREESAAAGRNPLLRCGLVLAPRDPGAAASPPSGDAILWGEDVLESDLGRTETVILSACETNVGVPTRGEGLFALQRAFHLAGARTVVASLWKVDDDATAAFMEEFYRNVFERRLGKAEGFRRAQVAMLRRYDPAARRLRPEPAQPDPPGSRSLPAAYWAAFVLSGDWR